MHMFITQRTTILASLLAFHNKAGIYVHYIKNYQSSLLESESPYIHIRLVCTFIIPKQLSANKY